MFSNSTLQQIFNKRLIVKLWCYIKEEYSQLFEKATRRLFSWTTVDEWDQVFFINFKHNNNLC